MVSCTETVFKEARTSFAPFKGRPVIRSSEPRGDLNARAGLEMPTNLEKRVRHPSANDHLVDLVEHVVDELDLVVDLGTAQDGEERTLGVRQHLGEVFQLLLNEKAGRALLKSLEKVCFYF